MFVIAGWFPQLLWAQTREKQPMEILDEVTAKTKSYQSIKLDFSYQMENPDANLNETTTGTAVIKGDKYHLQIAGQTIISDGKTLWTIIQDAREVQINNAGEGEETFTPTSLLSRYREQHRAKLLPKITSLQGKNVYAIELIPTVKKNYQKVNVYIDKDKMQLYMAEIFDQNGNKYTYKITRFETNVPVNESLFTFNQKDFPDYYIIDMR